VLRRLAGHRASQRAVTVSTRNVRDVIITGFEGVLREENCHPGKVHAIALKLAAVVEGHGVSLSRPAHLHDPVADDWRPAAGDMEAGRKAALAAIRPYEGPDTRRENTGARQAEDQPAQS
jgi:hypothetical protein